MLSLKQTALQPLMKASNIELFYDLIFVFCMRNIAPVITHASAIDWYTYYTFGFTFVLMLQIWFYTTLFMNRYGTGKGADALFLVTNMFLLFVMTRAISTGWEDYVTYNVCWILIFVNFIAHWILRWRMFNNLDEADFSIITRTVLVIGVQILVVAISTALPSVPGQIGSFLAVAIGFVNWGAGPFYRLKPSNFEHLCERCALLVILTFGETIIGMGEVVMEHAGMSYSILMFALIVLMFLSYLNEFENALDQELESSEMGYMAVTVWVVFCVANVTVGLELMMEEKEFLIPTNMYLAISVALYLLSFLLFIPFNKKAGRIRRRWVAVRIVASALILLSPIASQAHPLLGVTLACICVGGMDLRGWFLFRSWKQNQHGTSIPAATDAATDAAPDAAPDAALTNEPASLE